MHRLPCSLQDSWLLSVCVIILWLQFHEFTKPADVKQRGAPIFTFRPPKNWSTKSKRQPDGFGLFSEENGYGGGEWRRGSLLSLIIPNLSYKLSKHKKLFSRIHRWGLTWGRSGWESAYQCRGHGFDPWPGRIPHAAEQLSPCARLLSLCSRAHEPKRKKKKNIDERARIVDHLLCDSCLYIQCISSNLRNSSAK